MNTPKDLPEDTLLNKNLPEFIKSQLRKINTPFLTTENPKLNTITISSQDNGTWLDFIFKDPNLNSFTLTLTTYEPYHLLLEKKLNITTQVEVDAIIYYWENKEWPRDFFDTTEYV